MHIALVEDNQEQDLTPLVFLTGELSYVFDGYKVSALDYLLKPVAEAELDRVLSKAQGLTQDQQLDLVLETEAGLIARPLSQIMYAEAQGKYLEIHVNQHPQATEVIRIRESLETWGQAWPQGPNKSGQTLSQPGPSPLNFSHQVDVLVQPHLSYLVNLRWLAKRAGIRIYLTVHVLDQLSISDTDLCIILGNLLDNAMEACAELEPDQRYIRLYLDAIGQQFYLSIQNSAKEILSFEEQHYISTKRGNHGLGLKRVAFLVENYEGFLNLQNEPGIFAVEVSIPLEKKA